MNKILDLTCPHCSSGRVVRNGTRGGRQLFRCKNLHCGKRFGEAGAVGGYTYPPEAVGAGMRKFYGGESFGSIASYITDTFKPPGIKTSAETIRRWVTEFSPALIKVWLESPPDPGLWGYWRRWSVHFWKGSRPISWVVVMDDDSRYILACSARWANQKAALREAIVFARERSGILNGTSFVMRLVDRSPHKSNERSLREIKHVLSNELVSWVQRPARGVSSTFSGGSSALDLEPLTLGPFPKGYSWIKDEATARRYLEGWAADYNFFLPQSELDNQTPSQVAGLPSTYSDWVDLVVQQLCNDGIPSSRLA